ncbi:MAG TPA: hypothetical protein VLL49_10475, partial [Anaerolineales bacterium]|nr:hypothetical protein [Anaerolineales bacterium]
ATAILLYRLIRDTISEVAGVLAACFWAFNTHILVFLYKTGVESSITLFLVLVLLHALHRFEKTWRTRPPSLRQIAGLAALAVLVTFGRLDLAFFCLIVGIWIVFRDTPARFYLPFDLLALVIATVSAFVTRLGFAAYYDSQQAVTIMLVAEIVCKIPIFFLFGLYGKPSSGRRGQYLARLVLAVAVGSSLPALVLLGGSAAGVLPVYSRAILLLDAAVTLGLVLGIRLGAVFFGTRSSPAGNLSPWSALREHGRRWLQEGAVFYGILGGTLAAYMLWNQLAFGTPTPVSGQIKHWWGTFTHSIYGTSAGSWLTFFALNPFSEFNAWAPLTTLFSDWHNQLLFPRGNGLGNPRWQSSFAVMLIFCGLALLAVAALSKKSTIKAVVKTGMIPLFAGSWLQILAYNVTGFASAKEWYWLLQPVFLLLMLAVLVRAVLARLGRQAVAARYALWALAAWYGATSGFGYWRDAYALNPYGLHPPGTAYSPVIPFLEENTEPGALVGMTGGGNVGYLMPSRTIVNMDGLINSYQYFEAMQAGTGSDYLYNTGLRYVFANPTILAANPYRGQYVDRLELLVDWGGKDLLRLLPRVEQ